MEKLFLLREIILSRIYVVKNTNLFIYIYVVKKYQSVYIHMAPLPNTFFFCQFLLLSFLHLFLFAIAVNSSPVSMSKRGAINNNGN